MAEELIQRNLLASPEQIGDWSFYNIGATTLRQLKAAKIIPNRNYSEYERKKPDAIIVQKPNVIAAIEYKDPSELKTDDQIRKAIVQELGTAKALRAKALIVTDGSKTIWINPETGSRILLPDGNPVTLNFDKGNAECIELLRRVAVSVGADCDMISESVVVDPLPLARKVWQDLWAVSGATPEKCLYTFVEIFIFKFLSDLEILAPGRAFQDVLDQFERGSDEDALRFYASLVRPEIKRHFKESPIDGTTIINGMIFVTKDGEPVKGYATTFKTILQRFEQFGKLDTIDRDFKSRLFETFLKESISKKNWGQFFTPLKVVRAIVSMADVEEGMSVCDPACGVGKFLLEPLVSDDGRFVKVENGKLVSKLKLTGLDKGFDKEEQRTIILAKANMLIYLSSLIKSNPGLSEDLSDLLNKTFLLQTDSILGTLAKPVSEEFDLILTNPPYVMSGSGNLKGEISKHEELRQYYSVNAMGVEGLFMEWIVRALKRGGKAFVVVPDGVLIREHDRRLRDFLMSECVIDAIISLPLNTFFTTNKKTYIIALTKKRLVKQDGIEILPEQADPVLTYLCSEVGETRDVNRFPLEQNDLESASNCFNMFKGAKEAFSTGDSRCKLQPIERFKTESTWAVDTWWTYEEKVELGIEDEVETVSVSDFVAMIDDVASTLAGISAELSEVVEAPFAEAPDNGASMEEVLVSDLFDIARGSGMFTKSYVMKHPGDYPVYSGNTFGAFGYVESYDFAEPCLSWSIDGLAGRVMKHDTPFSATNHRGVLLPKSPDINLDYVRLVLEPVLRDLKKGRIGSRGHNEYTTLPPYLMKDAKIAIPVRRDGGYDVDLQGRVADVILAIEGYLDEMLDMRNMLADVSLDLNLGLSQFEERRLVDFARLAKGNSKYTRKYGNSHPGRHPVYSASHEEPLAHIATFDYEGRYLTWATNGFAGMMKVLDGKFSLNGDRGIILLESDEVDIDYLRLVLEPRLRQLAKGRKGDRGANEFTKLYVSMMEEVVIPMPIKADGTPDLSAQKAISLRHEHIEQYREKTLKAIDSLLAKSFVLSSYGTSLEQRRR